jgi:hypothetical protein
MCLLVFPRVISNFLHGFFALCVNVPARVNILAGPVNTDFLWPRKSLDLARIESLLRNFCGSGTILYINERKAI